MRLVQYETQRICVWLVALARTNLVKENEPEENPLGFSEYTQTKQLVIHVVATSYFSFKYLIALFKTGSLFSI